MTALRKTVRFFSKCVFGIIVCFSAIILVLFVLQFIVTPSQNEFDNDTETWHHAENVMNKVQSEAKQSGLSDEQARSIARDAFIATGPDK